MCKYANVQMCKCADVQMCKGCATPVAVLTDRKKSRQLSLLFYLNQKKYFEMVGSDLSGFARPDDGRTGVKPSNNPRQFKTSLTDLFIINGFNNRIRI